MNQILLSHFFQQGKEILEKMRTSLAQKDYHAVIHHWNRLRELAQTMAKKDDKIFLKTAQSLLGTGLPFEKQARLYLALGKIPRRITAIVIESSPKKIREALINSRWCREGDLISDAKGNLLELQVRKIQRRKVVFLYRGMEITGDLEE